MLLLYFTASLSSLIPLSVGIWLFPKLNFQMRILFFLFVIVLLVEGSTYYLGHNNKNPYWIHHIYMPIEYGFMAFIFSYWQRTLLIRNALRISIPIFTLLCLWDIFVSGNLHDLNDFTASIAFTLYVGISAFTLLHLQTDNFRYILRNYRFWISAGLLIYSAGGLAYFSFHDIVVSDLLVQVWAIHAVLNIVLYSFYAIGFICQTR